MAYIFNLSNDVLKLILDHIESNPQYIIPIDRREHLSVESFRPPTPPPPSQVHDVGNFRLSCRRFAELGISYQFSRISLRFSKQGFKRLDEICSNDHITGHTKKFSYMVPPFYSSTSRPPNNSERSALTTHLERKISEQRSLLGSREDVRVLRKAMKSFTSLQHVQLLRLIEPLELSLPRSSNANTTLEWPRACTHATKTMGEALLSAPRSPFCRFSGPMMEPHTARIVQEHMLSLLASKLTCLELHFDGGPELAERMTELSSLARTVLMAARNLQAIHVGFPSRIPLDLRLETMFHHITWENLRAFGIQAWRLDSAEIISVVRRHRKTLKGLRLRDVQLKPGSKWRDILVVLRNEMRQLDWVSLRRIDYEEHFDAVWGETMEVPDPDDAAPGSSSSSAASSSTSSDNEDDAEEYPGGGTSEDDLSDQESVLGSEVEDSDEDSTADTDHGPEADDIAISPDTPITLPFCTCDRRSDDGFGGGSGRTRDEGDELGDNGESVAYQQRKMWERWVVGRCPEHA